VHHSHVEFSLEKECSSIAASTLLQCVENSRTNGGWSVRWERFVCQSSFYLQNNPDFDQLRLFIFVQAILADPLQAIGTSADPLSRNAQTLLSQLFDFVKRRPLGILVLHLACFFLQVTILINSI
jgi:hypothetical protein